MKANAPSQFCPVVCGTGLLALDVTVGADETASAPLRVWAGGTFGNVLAALRFLGWHGKPFARLGGDSAGELIVQDLTAIGVETSFVEREDGARTPVILHRIRRVAGGGRAHGFGWACPKCGERYPSFRPVLSGRAAELTGNLVGSAVFFGSSSKPGPRDFATTGLPAGCHV
jgi:hypothetical protein